MPGPYPQLLIPIEALSEYDVQEINLDGREILEKPSTPAEHFQKILNRIDFSKNYDEKTASQIDSPGDQKTAEKVSPKLWMSVRKETHTALTELNAFVDILAVIKEGRYLSVYPVASEQPEPNMSLVLAGKKRALSTAADILLKGTERLRRRYSELADARSRLSVSGTGDQNISSQGETFHKTLMQLRQEWRLKLHQNTILGDVSLRPIGSRFRESGNFEVRESDLVAQQKPDPTANHSDSTSGVEIVFSRSLEALLNTTANVENLSVSIYESRIDSGPVPLWHCVFERPTRSRGSSKPSDGFFQPDPTRPSLVTQRERLVKAQKILACREILFTLSCEACGLRGNNFQNADCASFATEDQLIASLFPGVQISISMDKSMELDSSSPQKPVSVKSSVRPRLTGDANDLMEIRSLGLQLHRILAAQHRSAWSNLASLPQCACGPVQVPARYRASGANALTACHFSGDPMADPSTQLSQSNFSIAVASVAGFAGAAATAWSTLNLNNRQQQSSTSTFDRTDPRLTMSQQRIPTISITQDRLSLFTEWGVLHPTGHSSLPPLAPNAVINPTITSGSNPFDESVPGTANVAAVEHILCRRKADDSAIQSVIGSSSSLLDRTTVICKHYYLREKVSNLLCRFARDTPLRLIVHWDAINSAIFTSARICCYAINYDAYRSWMGLSISHSGVSLYLPDPPRHCYIGTDLARLKILLSNRIIQSQMHFLDILVTKILGWTRIGSNPSSGSATLDDTFDDLVSVRLFASPSGSYLACIRASVTTGLRLFISKLTPHQIEVGQLFSVEPTDFCAKDVHIPGGPFREIRLSDVRSGSHAVAQIEAILTVLP
ncbi:Mediator of RNA polymerase II transcription subunit 17 [Fasciolopsis buskii]|uniref:Mediator of RNA polymerase II transcription subunit 17 n=1 Tax=Fasciolopsis buskii TaxID=27845 RepID=A0A8E0VDE2_9TREM|nr:Mediator of RNA polymerase II transcription subunit 17 [Fasciolopsis buski]